MLVNFAMGTMLLQTLIMRPYVVAFLISFLVISVLNRGAARTVLLLCIGGGIAYLSEWMSIRWGIPYGDYMYIYSAMKDELIVGGVPLWDSISYSFLAYASYETVSFLRWQPRVLLSALLMTLADLVIDPITIRGDQWFLGKVYFYPEGGIYFGVPVSNFVGWFIVAYVILAAYEYCAKRWIHRPEPLKAPQFGVYFYYGILAFICSIGLFIKEFAIVFVSFVVHLPILWALKKRFARNKRPST